MMSSFWPDVSVMLGDPVFYLALGRGLLLTLEIALVTIALSFIFGVIFGVARFSKIPGLSQLATIYIEFIRNIPLLLLLLTCYFVAGLPSAQAAILGLTIFTTAIIAEVVRGGLNSIQRGQWEAAKSQGFNYVQTLRYIVLPQAITKMIPPIVSQFVTVIKDSSFAMAIGAFELMYEGTILAGQFWKATQIITIYIIIALIYFLVNFTLSSFSRLLQTKLSEGQGTIN